MRKLIYILFLFPGLLMAQDFQYRKSGGKFMRSGGKIVKSAPYTAPEEEEEETADFDTVVVWDFESQDIGAFLGGSSGDDFKEYFYQADNTTHFFTGDDSILNKTLNGESTKVLKVHHPGFDGEWHDGEGIMGKSYIRGNGATGQGATDTELYLTYNVQFAPGFQTTRGGKIPGFYHSPECSEAGYCPTYDEGFYTVLLFKEGNKLSDYYYDHTPDDPGGESCPWSTDQNKERIGGYWAYDSIWFNNGNWYNITQRLVLNTFTEEVANADGINEVWVDGRMVYQRDDLKLAYDDSIYLNAVSIGMWYGGTETFAPVNDCETYFDNFIVWTPGDDSVTGNNLHAPEAVLPTPYTITDRSWYYNHLVTTTDTIETNGYDTPLDSCENETWLIQAPKGQTITFTVLEGRCESSDHVFVYDGGDTDSPLLDYVNMPEGSDDDLTDNFGGDGAVTSTNNEMFIRVVNNRSLNYTRLRANITFNE